MCTRIIDTESWDSNEEIYGVSQGSDSVWDTKGHRPTFSQSHKLTLPSSNTCEYGVFKYKYYNDCYLVRSTLSLQAEQEGSKITIQFFTCVSRFFSGLPKRKTCGYTSQIENSNYTTLKCSNMRTTHC